MRKTLLILFIVIFVAGNACSESILSRYSDDFKHIVTAPARIEKSDILPLSILAGSIGGLMLVDEGIRTFSQDAGNRNSVFNGLFSLTGKFAEGYVMAPVLGAFYLAGSGLKDDKLKKIGILGAESYVSAAIVTFAVKCLLGRSRPERDEGNGMFNLFETEYTKRSFPSGHTSSAFSVASVIAGQYNIYVDIGVYTLAGLTGLSRIYHDNHWASDVLAGAVLGTLIGRAIVKLNGSKNKSIELLPFIDSNTGQYGMKIVLNK